MSLVARTTNSSEGIQWIYNYDHYQSPENAAPMMSYDLRAARTLLQDNGIDLVGTLGGAEKDKLTVATLDFWDANNQLWAEVDFLKENPQEIIPDDFGGLSCIYPVDGQITYQGLVIDQIPGYAYLSANLSVSLEDCVVPTYVEGSIAAPASGSFTPGMIIPITVTFSEPVIGGTAKAVVNGQTLTAAEDADTFSRRQTFLYEVKPLDNESIAVTELSGAKDYGDHVAEAVKPGGDNGTVLCSGLLSSEYVQGKIDSVVMDQQEYAPYDTEGTLTVNLADLGAEVEQESTFWANTKLTAVLDDGTEIPLTLEEPESGTFVFTGTVPFGANSTEQEINRTVELYFQENEGERQLYFGKAAAFTQLPAQYLDNTEFSIQTTNFPAKDETIFADQEAVLGVQAVLAQGATGTWSDVTDPDQFTWGVEVWQQGADGAGQWVADATGSVASIVPDGEDASKATVALGSSGKFRVTLTAHNGDTADTPADQRHAVTVYSSAVTVGLGNNPILRIAPNLQSISIQSGQDAILRWTSNLTEKQQELGNPSQTFKIEVFQALDSNYQRPEDGAAPDLADVSKWKALEPITADSTPEQTLSTYALSGLTQVSVTGGYSYAIRLSGEYAGTTYTAYAYVAVSSRPAVVELEQPALYWTERTGAGGVDLRWTVRNFDTANETSTDFSVTVLNNDTGMVVASGGKETLSGSGDDRSGSLHFDFSTLQQGNWREAYTVELRARNDTESTWSYDSAVLYYYDDSAFQIYVNGAPAEDSLTMSNEKNPVDGTDKTVAAMTRDEILALGRNIALSDEIGINPLVPWGNVR